MYCHSVVHLIWMMIPGGSTNYYVDFGLRRMNEESSCGQIRYNQIEHIRYFLTAAIKYVSGRNNL